MNYSLPNPISSHPEQSTTEQVNDNVMIHSSDFASSSDTDNISDTILIPAEEVPSSEFADLPVLTRIIQGDSSASIGSKSSSKTIKPSYEFQPIEMTASRNISRNIDANNIIPSRSRHRATVALSSTTPHSSSQGPISYSQALSQPDRDNCIKAITRELNDLKDMDVWEEVNLPSDAHAIGTTWVFKKEGSNSVHLDDLEVLSCADGQEGA